MARSRVSFIIETNCLPSSLELAEVTELAFSKIPFPYRKPLLITQELVTEAGEVLSTAFLAPVR